MFEESDGVTGLSLDLRYEQTRSVKDSIGIVSIGVVAKQLVEACHEKALFCLFKPNVVTR